MAVPSVPSDDSSGNVWTASKVNAIYDHLAWAHGTSGQAPLGKFWMNPSASTGSSDEVNLSGGTGTFNQTPRFNLGGFTAGTGGDAGVYLPETGYYRATVHTDWANNSTGRRQHWAQLEGVDINASYVAVDACATTNTRLSSTFTFDATAGDEVSVFLFQNSGTSLTTTVHLELEWVRAS